MICRKKETERQNEREREKEWGGGGGGEKKGDEIKDRKLNIIL